MNGRMLLQLGCLFWAEAQALLGDPDNKLAYKDGYAELARTDLRRPLTPAERREFDRLEATSRQAFYRARTMGFVCNGTDHAFGGAPQEYGPWR